MDYFARTEQIVNILLAERKRTLTLEEEEILFEWQNESDGNRALYESLKNDSNIPLKLKELAEYKKEEAYSEFIRQTRKSKIRVMSRTILKYAAIIVPLLLSVWFFYPEKSEMESIVVSSGIQPGTSKAILKLDDGSIVNLEENENLISECDGTIISNNKKEIVYKSKDKKLKSRKLKYNTIEIPRGGEYQLILSDGTKVWLNSETTIKYPVYFTANSRDVYLEGEAFFEVVENKERPFIVHTPEMNVNVLGTSFNVRAYTDEQKSSTTLVTGKVLINQSESKKEYTLNPNEQAVISNHDAIIKTVNVNPFISWKNGRILFENNTMEEIFNDLSRWYNIEVNYSNPELKSLRFSIDVERYNDFGDILEILELTQKISFEINEKSVIINEKE